MTDTEDQIEQTLRQHFAEILVPQVQRLGAPETYFPTSGYSGYGMASGYLIGVCERIVTHNGHDLNDTPYLGRLMGTAFSSIYGDEGEKLGLATIAGLRNGDANVVHGYQAGRVDIDNLVTKPDYAPMGFFAFVSGPGASTATLNS